MSIYRIEARGYTYIYRPYASLSVTSWCAFRSPAARRKELNFFITFVFNCSEGKSLISAGLSKSLFESFCAALHSSQAYLSLGETTRRLHFFLRTEVSTLWKLHPKHGFNLDLDAPLLSMLKTATLCFVWTIDIKAHQLAERRTYRLYECHVVAVNKLIRKL